jgi:putative mRNA 3-end processing factor
MNNAYPIDVFPSGAVILGQRICCDGFHRDYEVRVQTHVHIDHMDRFETSK